MNIQDLSPTLYIEFDTEYPSITSTAESEIGKPGALAELFVGGELYMLDIDPLTGRYSWTAPVAFLDGSYSVSLRFIDNTGNFGDPLLFTMVIDTVPPEAPDLIKIYDDFGPERVGLEPGDTTDDKRPTLTGIAQKGTTVYLLNDNGEKIGSAVADTVTGKWVMEPSQDLEDGVNSLRLVAEEVFANKTRMGTPSEPFTLVIDSGALPPGTLTITDAYDDAGSFTGPLSNGALTDDTTPTLRGTASAGSTVIVYYRMAGAENWLGSASATVTGESWSWTPGSALPFGSYEFRASAGSFSSEFFTLDIADQTEIARRTRIESVEDDFGPAVGFLANGAITDDGTPTFRGSAEANSKVVVRYTLSGNISTSVTVDADSAGKWSWTPGSDLSSGLWTFDVQMLGKTAWSDSFALNITGAGGFAPIINYAFDDVGDTGERLSGSTTDDTTPTLHGRAEANSVVYLRYGLAGNFSSPVTLTADASGNWQWTPPAALADGNWAFEVQKSGQINWNSFALTIDRSFDRNPTIEYAVDNVGTVTDTLYSGDVTDDTTPTLYGRGEANSTITLRYIRSGGSATSVNVQVNSNGDWSWTSPTLSTGSWTFEVQKSGKPDWNKFALKIDPTVDLQPTITSVIDDVGKIEYLYSGDTTDDSTPVFFGNAASDSLVYFKASKLGVTLYYSFQSNSSGKWEWTPPTAFANGNWSFQLSKSPDKNWGTSFNLIINGAGGDGGGGSGNMFLDFENHAPGNIGPVSDGNVSYGSSGTVYVGLVSSPAAAPNFGSVCLLFSSVKAGFSYTALKPHKYMKTFSFEVYQPSFYPGYQSKFDVAITTTTGRYMVKNILKPSGSVQTYTFDSSELAPGEWVRWFTIHNAPGIYVDNISGVTQGGSVTSIITSLEDDSLYQLDAIEELVNASITGRDGQIDTLQITGQQQTLDLTQYQDRIQSIEIIDLTGSGNNTLKLNLESILALGEKNLFIEDGKNQLIVKGNEGDVVQLKDILPEGEDISEWVHLEGSVTVAGVKYDVYSHGDDAELLVQQGVKTELV
jgi:hypothetical protein